MIFINQSLLKYNFYNIYAFKLGKNYNEWMLLSPKYNTNKFGYNGLTIYLIIADFLFKSISSTQYPTTTPWPSPPLSSQRNHSPQDPDTPCPINNNKPTQLPLFPHNNFPQTPLKHSINTTHTNPFL